MVAPYRLKRSVPAERETKPTAVAAFQSYLDRLIKMIPAEVIGLYLVGSGIIPTGQRVAFIVWALICLIAVVVVRIFGTNDPDAVHRIDWPHVVISAIAFLIWVYTIGGPNNPFGSLYQSYVGSLLVLVWTFFVPMIYHGAD